MTMSLTFMATGNGGLSRMREGMRVLRCAAVLVAAVLVAVAAPVSACDKSGTPVASTSRETRSTATFTGELVNGVPVYRLPAITVVGRRQADVAKTQRNDASPRAGRLRASAGGESGPTAAIQPADSPERYRREGANDRHNPGGFHRLAACLGSRAELRLVAYRPPREL